MKPQLTDLFRRTVLLGLIAFQIGAIATAVGARGADPALSMDRLFAAADARGPRVRANLELTAHRRYLDAVNASVAQGKPLPDPADFYARAENYVDFSAPPGTEVGDAELKAALRHYDKGSASFVRNVEDAVTKKNAAKLLGEQPARLADIEFSLGKSGRADFYRLAARKLPGEVSTLFKAGKSTQAETILSELAARDPGAPEMIDLFLDIQRASPDARVLTHLRASLASARPADRQALEAAVLDNKTWVAQIHPAPVPVPPTTGKPAWTAQRYRDEVIAKRTGEHELLQQKSFLESLDRTSESASDYFKASQLDFPSRTRGTSPEAVAAREAELNYYMQSRPSVSALRKQVRTLLADPDVASALFTKQPEEAWRFKELMPESLLKRKSAYYSALEASLEKRITAAGRDPARGAALSETLGNVARNDRSDALAGVYVRLQAENPEQVVIVHLKSRLSSLEPAAQSRVRDFMLDHPEFAAQTVPAAPPAPPAAPAPGSPVGGASRKGPLPSSFSYAEVRGLGKSRDCLANSFRAFIH